MDGSPDYRRKTAPGTICQGPIPGERDLVQFWYLKKIQLCVLIRAAMRHLRGTNEAVFAKKSGCCDDRAFGLPWLVGNPQAVQKTTLTGCLSNSARETGISRENMPEP